MKEARYKKPTDCMILFVNKGKYTETKSLLMVTQDSEAGCKEAIYENKLSLGNDKNILKWDNSNCNIL